MLHSMNNQLLKEYALVVYPLCEVLKTDSPIFLMLMSHSGPDSDHNETLIYVFGLSLNHEHQNCRKKVVRQTLCLVLMQGLNVSFLIKLTFKNSDVCFVTG